MVVRSINKVHDQLISHEYETGLSTESDKMTKVYMSELLAKTIGECPSSFNETQLFNNQFDEIEH